MSIPFKRPNFLLIVADDLGYSDVGCFGSEIETPNIDRLAKEGMRFSDFHASPACSTTRAMLVTGTDSHLTGLGVMAEQRCSGGERWDKVGHEGYLNFDVATVAEILAEEGYYNLFSGKWHLGFKPECDPHYRGFHRSLALLPGQTNHWAFHPELKEPNSFFGRMPILHTEQGKRKLFPTNTGNDYDKGFYSSNYYTDNLIRYFEERSPPEKEKPFFAMLPFAAPHWPLQCSKEDREKYKGVYDDGPAALRLRRLARLKELGLIPADCIPHEVIGETSPGVAYPEWEEMTELERKKSSRAMECYAGMVDNIDQNVGKIVKYLEDLGVADDTVICFMSDNGSEGAAIEAWPTLGKDILGIVRQYYDNRLDNIGNYNSFAWYGPRWAQAATAPSKLYKMYSTEGGIRVPFVMRFPAGKGLNWPENKVISGLSTVTDIVPTLLDIAGVKHPVVSGAVKGEFQGRQIYGMTGRSWLKALGETSGIGNDVDMFYKGTAVGWELFGRAALRKGHWKITYMPSTHWGKDRWELFDLSKDPGERIDLSSKYPEKYTELLSAWRQYVVDTGTVWGTPSDDLAPGIIQESGKTMFGSMPEDSIGGDPFDQCTAWMEVGEGQEARPTLPSYEHIPGFKVPPVV